MLASAHSPLNVTAVIDALELLEDATAAHSMIKQAIDEQITNYVAFFGFTVLVWDHIITFGDEVECIWRRKKNLLVYLFLLNRYFTPLGFIVNITAYLSQWPPEVCKKFVRYEGSCTIIAIEVVALMMLMRIKALYEGQWKVIGFVASMLALETAVNAWLMTHGEAVTHTGSVYGCTMIFDPKLKAYASLSAWLPLIYDTIVIVLTLHKCREPVKQKTASYIVRALVRDGLLYYSVIFTINVILAIMIATASPGIKNIAAQLEQLLTVAMMSRITLSLKRPSVIDDEGPYYPGHPLPAYGVHARFSGSRSLPWHVSIPPSLRSPNMSPTSQASIPYPRASLQKDKKERTSRPMSFAGFPAPRSLVSFFSFGDEHDEATQRHIASIQEHSPLSERQAYELRSLKAPAADSIEV